MDFAMVATWVFVGLLAGWLAGFVMKDGGYGLVWNLVLGLVGSSAAIVILSVLGVAPRRGDVRDGRGCVHRRGPRDRGPA